MDSTQRIETITQPLKSPDDTDDDDADDEESEDHPYGNLSVKEIRQLIEKAKRDKKVFETENKLLLSYLSEKSPDFLKEVESKLNRLPKAMSNLTFPFLTRIVSMTSDHRSSRSRNYSFFSHRTSQWSHRISQHSKFGSMRTVSSTANQRITTRMKIEIAERALNTLAKLIQKKERDTTKQIDELHRDILEHETSYSEMLERMDKFDRNVLIAGVDSITNRVPAETFMKFLTAEIDAESKYIAKLRLRSGAMKTHIKFLRKQNEEKEQMSEMLRPVDYELMLIEKKRLKKELAQKNQAITGLRKVNGRIEFDCNQQKKTLEKKIETIKTCQNKTNHLKSLTNRWLKERTKFETELNTMNEKMTDMTKQMKQVQVPGIDDYINQQKRLEEIKHQEKILTRQINLQNAKQGNPTIQINIKTRSRPQVCISWTKFSSQFTMKNHNLNNG